MKNLIIVVFLLLDVMSAHAADLNRYFATKAGNWELVSGWAKDFNSDGAVQTETLLNLQKTSIKEQAGRWNIYEDFCGSSNGSSFCGQSLAEFEISNNELFRVNTEDHTKIPVEILRATDSELDIRFEVNGMAFVLLESLSGNTLVRTSQVQVNGRVIEVGFLSLKRSAK